MAKPFVNPFVSGQFLELRVDALVSDGRGLGRHDGVVVLVEDALPGQLVRARVAAVRKSLAEAALVEVLERSPDEQEPPCPHAGRCGGCSWQSRAYGRQLAWKERIVHDALERVGKVACPPILPILPSPSEWGYRNKMEFAFGVSGDGGKALGLRERGSRNIVEVTGCLLQTPLTMRVLEAVRMLSNGAFHDLDGRFLVVREPNAGGCFVELIVGAGGSLEAGERFAEALRAETPEVTGFALSERLAPSDVAYGERALYADGRLEERIGDVRRPPGLPRLRNCRILSCGTCTAAWVPSGCTWGAMRGLWALRKCPARCVMPAAMRRRWAGRRTRWSRATPSPCSGVW